MKERGEKRDGGREGEESVERSEGTGGRKNYIV